MEKRPPVQQTFSVSLRRPLRTLPRGIQLLIVLVVVLVVSAVFGLGSIRGYLFGSPSDINAKQVAVPGTFRPTQAQWSSLKTVPVATMTFRTRRVTDGKIAINSDKATPVFSPYSGRVTKIIANPGDYVSAGAPLLAVEASEFVQGQNDLINAMAALDTARSQLTRAQANQNRKHALYDAKAGALQDWEQSQADLVTAQNNLRSAEIALALVRNRLRILGKTDAQIGALENAQMIDPATFLLAPISGTVIDRQVGLGQYIQSSATNPVYSIGDLSTVWLVANVRELDAPFIRLGEPVEVHVLAFPERLFKARLAYVAPAVDPNTRRLLVRAVLENADRALKPEMFANFTIFTDGESVSPAVPEESIVYEGDTARVWVAQENGTILSRQIHVGRIANGMVEVDSGLTPGEKIVTSGTLFIDRAAKGD
jgi:membrane fusion protein, heavy metal efflux system